jgi:hypothetical protein
MDILGKAGQAVGDVVAKSKERERVRLEDRLRLIDALDGAAQHLVLLRKLRPGYGWHLPSEEQSLKTISGAAALGDEALATKVDSLIELGTTSIKGPPRRS